MEDYFIGISLIVVCSSLLAWLACRSRQPVILGYFLCGILIGPVGLGYISEVESLEHISRIGVALLLFLAGLVLHPDRLKKFFKTALSLTLASCVLTWIIVFACLSAFGYSPLESTVAGLALMFSSTILVVKLLPTITLHQKKMGSICIAVLIAQDLIAVSVLMFLDINSESAHWLQLLLLPVKVVLLIVFAVVGEQFVVRKMMRSTDKYHEVLVMLCLGWCVGNAMLAEVIGLSYEVGAFIAGVAMARGKIARVLSEQLKPLRDFFLMFFFFVLGATFELSAMRALILPALILGVLIIVFRPIVFKKLLVRAGEEPGFARETGMRLGQASEFALIIAVAAVHNNVVEPRVAQLIQLTTVFTMLVSSYIVILKFPTPLGVSPALKRD